MSWLMSALTVDRDDGFVDTADSDDHGYDAGGYDDDSGGGSDYA
jgi:hypothetical protein